MFYLFPDLKHTPGETAEESVFLLGAALIMGHDAKSLQAGVPTVLSVNRLDNLRIC